MWPEALLRGTWPAHPQAAAPRGCFLGLPRMEPLTGALLAPRLLPPALGARPPHGASRGHGASQTPLRRARRSPNTRAGGGGQEPAGPDAELWFRLRPVLSAPSGDPEARATEEPTARALRRRLLSVNAEEGPGRSLCRGAARTAPPPRPPAPPAAGRQTGLDAVPASRQVPSQPPHLDGCQSVRRKLRPQSRLLCKQAFPVPPGWPRAETFPVAEEPRLSCLPCCPFHFPVLPPVDLVCALTGSRARSGV